ncbi:hypothetical protein RFI_16898, partial [Reticulomyxa filosa]
NNNNNNKSEKQDKSMESNTSIDKVKSINSDRWRPEESSEFVSNAKNKKQITEPQLKRRKLNHPQSSLSSSSSSSSSSFSSSLSSSSSTLIAPTLGTGALCFVFRTMSYFPRFEQNVDFCHIKPTKKERWEGGGKEFIICVGACLDETNKKSMEGEVVDGSATTRPNNAHATTTTTTTTITTTMLSKEDLSHWNTSDPTMHCDNTSKSTIERNIKHDTYSSHKETTSMNDFPFDTDDINMPLATEHVSATAITNVHTNDITNVHNHNNNNNNNNGQHLTDDEYDRSNKKNNKEEANATDSFDSSRHAQNDQQLSGNRTEEKLSSSGEEHTPLAHHQSGPEKNKKYDSKKGARYANYSIWFQRKYTLKKKNK